MKRRELEPLLVELTGGNDERAEAAARQLAAAGPALLPALQELLASHDPDRRWWAVRVLAEVVDHRVLPLLLKAFGDTDRSVRQCAALALRQRPAAAATTSPSRASVLFEAEALAAWERETAARFERYFVGPSDDGLGARLRADLGEWLPNNLLAKVDRATMAVSLEARVPFLDHRVVERAATMPDRLKIAHGATKVVLRRAFRDLVPEAVLSRPKRGFDLPLDAWMRGPLRELARERFASGVLGRWPLLRPGSAENLLNRHAMGGHGLGLPSFLLLSLAEFLDARG